jgi:glutamyl-tRNA synthetase
MWRMENDALEPAGSHTSQPNQTAAPVRGRFAPTPSGRMHLGNVWCALAAWLAVRSGGGTLVLRIEDLDPRKSPAGAEEALVDDLRWLGLDWDEGPVRQSERTALYARQVERLREAGLTYPCFCSRADLHVAEAPHASDGTPLYPGTCRALTPGQVAERARLRNPGTRLRVPDGDDPRGTVRFTDEVCGPRSECLARECGDFLVRRSDGVFAYQLAVTVDDELMGVNQVVRGNDLLPSTARQIYLQRLLGFSRPVYAHVPLLFAEGGARRLSKRDRDCDLGFMRRHFEKPEVLLGKVAALVGLRPTDEPASAAELVEAFSWDALRAMPPVVEVPGSFFC